MDKLNDSEKDFLLRLAENMFMKLEEQSIDVRVMVVCKQWLDYANNRELREGYMEMIAEMCYEPQHDK